MLLDLWLQLGDLQLQENVELIEIGLHRCIHIGEASSGYLVSFGLGSSHHLKKQKPEGA
jgi:hypothetical protein